MRILACLLQLAAACLAQWPPPPWFPSLNCTGPDCQGLPPFNASFFQIPEDFNGTFPFPAGLPPCQDGNCFPPFNETAFPFPSEFNGTFPFPQGDFPFPNDVNASFPTAGFPPFPNFPLNGSFPAPPLGSSAPFPFFPFNRSFPRFPGKVPPRRIGRRDNRFPHWRPMGFFRFPPRAILP